jgi:uncharacterized membrane protein
MMSSVFVSAQLLGTFALGFSSSISIHAGDTGSLQITVTSIHNFVRPVYLSVSGAPAGVYVSFDYNPVTPPPSGSDFSTATFSVDASVHGGTYPMKLLGTSGEQVKNYDLTLDVTAAAPGDFGISVSPSSVSVSGGNSASATVTINSINHYSSSVVLTAGGEPSGVSVDFSPNPITPPPDGSANSIVTISTRNSAKPGTYYIEITAHGGGIVMIQHSARLNLQIISGGDFGISVSPSSVSVNAGASTTTTAYVNSVNGFSSSVSLSASGQPTGVVIDFSPSTVVPPAGGTASSMLTVSTASSAPAGSYVVTIMGSGNGGQVMLQHSTQLYLQITSTPTQDFAMAVNPSSISVQQGQSATVSVTISPIGGFSSAVSLATRRGVPPGVQVSFSPNPTYGFSIMTVAVASRSTPGTYSIRIAGASGSLSHVILFTLTISSQAQPSFSMSASPASVSLTPSGSATVSIVAASINGFSSSVSTSTSWSGQSPSGISVTGPGTLTPTPGVAASGNLVITGSANAPAGSYMLTVIGVSGPITAQTTVSVQVVGETGDFAVAANPGTVSITSGATGSTVLTVLSQNGFNSPVALSASWQGTTPSGVTFTLQSPVTPPSGSAATSTLTITATPAAGPGTYTLIVTGSSGALLHTTQVTILISQLVTTTTTSGGTPKCFIATATYGSPLAPEVQFLRTFRDREIMNTYVGWNFMIAFNAWYYSFSPAVAQSITQHPAAQAAMRAILYPLMIILRVGAMPFSLPVNRELAALASELVICLLIGVAYLALPLTLLARYGFRRRTIPKTIERVVGCTLILAVVGIAFAELLTSSPLMIFATTSTALSTLLLSAVAPARRLLLHLR